MRARLLASWVPVLVSWPCTAQVGKGVSSSSSDDQCAASSHSAAKERHAKELNGVSYRFEVAVAAGPAGADEAEAESNCLLPHPCRSH